MKKIYYFSLLGALFASTSTLLQAMEEEKSSTFTVKVWNKDIGPVKGGNFLRDQKWLLEDNKIYGRAPGSSLFVSPLKVRAA